MKIFNWNVKAITLFNFHSWMGFIVGLVMILVGFSGAIAVFKHEIEWLLTPELRAPISSQTVAIDEIMQTIQETYPGAAISLSLPKGPGWAYSASVGTRNGRFNVLVSPETGQITKTRRQHGYLWSVGNFIRQFHVRLLLGFWGRVFVGIFGVTIFLSCVTGIVIYRNWLKSMFQLRRKKRRRVFHMDLHKLIGFWSLIFNLLIGFTGAILGLENLYNIIQRRWVQPSETSSLASTQIPISGDGQQGEKLSASTLLLAAKQHFPKMKPATIDFPRDSTRAVTISGKHPGALLAYNTSRIRLHPYSGAVVSGLDARYARVSSKIYNILDPLHFGYFGEEFGMPIDYSIKTLWAVLGLTPGVLAITGAFMWWLRRKRRKGVGPEIKRHDALGKPTLHNGLPPEALSYQVRRGWKIFAMGLIPFLVLGYILQSAIWRDGWSMTELLFQHWIVKPVSLMVVFFPVSVYLYRVSKRYIVAFASGRKNVWLVFSGSISFGGWYLFTLCLLN